METKVNKSKVENKDTNKNSGNTENKRKRKKLGSWTNWTLIECASSQADFKDM